MRWAKELDHRIFRFTLRFSQEGLTHKLIRLVSRSGNWGLIWLLVCLILLPSPQNRRTSFMCLAALLTTTALGEGLLKRIFRRPRPYITHGPIELSSPMPRSTSFPSGHTASSVACARILASINPWVALLAYGFAGAMGFSRIYLRIHYISDVLVGGLIGLVCAEAVRWFLA